MDKGIDENVGSYNSLFLSRRCEDQQPLLFASHSDWLDVWEVNGLGTASLRISKVVKRQVKEKVVLWKGRPDFFTKA